MARLIAKKAAIHGGRPRHPGSDALLFIRANPSPLIRHRL